MLIPADAPEEAGCTDVTVLAHCRQRGEYDRECPVLNAILGQA
jgi:hypothetical protein